MQDYEFNVVSFCIASSVAVGLSVAALALIGTAVGEVASGYWTATVQQNAISAGKFFAGVLMGILAGACAAGIKNSMR